MIRAYEEIIDFIAAGTSPASVAAFHPSDESRQHVGDLIVREKEGALSPEEAADLGHYMQLEQLMRMAKARARRHLSGNTLNHS